jgi:hypothetical protein
MGLESATYINGLVVTNPTAGDPRAEGDDHLRLIKSVIKNTFPNITGAVTATQTDLNSATHYAHTYCTSLTSLAMSSDTWYSFTSIGSDVPEVAWSYGTLSVSGADSRVTINATGVYDIEVGATGSTTGSGLASLSHTTATTPYDYGKGVVQVDSILAPWFNLTARALVNCSAGTIIRGCFKIQNAGTVLLTNTRLIVRRVY